MRMANEEDIDLRAEKYANAIVSLRHRYVDSHVVGRMHLDGTQVGVRTEHGEA